MILEELASQVRLTRARRPFEAALEVPGDKSISHRAVLLASLAAGKSRILNLLQSADVRATMAAVKLLGAGLRGSAAEGWTVEGRGIGGYREPDRPIDCKNSGTTARLLTGLLAASPLFATLTGDVSLRRRPMGRVVRPLRAAGATILGRQDGERLPLAIRGAQLAGFDYDVPEASAQVKTALLLAALKARGRSRIAQRAQTRDHTEQMFEYLGVPFERDGAALTLVGPIEPAARDIEVPGDPSSAAFFVVAGLLVPGSCVTIRGVCLNPTRIGFVRVLERMGAKLAVRVTGSAAGEPVGELVAQASELSATEVSSGEIPSLVDEVPILAVAASQAHGTTWFRGVAELRAKESDRLAALRRELGALGASLREEGDDLAVTGPSALSGAVVDSHDDHRMAMALSVAALVTREVTTVRGHRCVRISFPDFYEKLGLVASSE